ncbi:ASCH domain-containing protein [Endomicrobium proavitum]|uniref:ASCH domain-containing protein n=1 Tax=Endomicrobium proavitum TaxID=1408281 RepID=A0A0G3WLZ3_9BACT|nr:ASCH domain-containing protein [Endomicrobium proavitum]AKL98474.1 hypothetical protein Epro_1095 [Endomicrobium proavitum]
MGIILSIKPQYAYAILNGTKKVEFRKKIFKNDVKDVFIYVTAPEKRIVGYFTISNIVENTPGQLWRKFGKVGGINRKDFFNYYTGLSHGYSICINNVEIFNNKVNPDEVFRKFFPPQSFVYLNRNRKNEILRRAFG